MGCRSLHPRLLVSTAVVLVGGLTACALVLDPSDYSDPTSTTSTETTSTSTTSAVGGAGGCSSCGGSGGATGGAGGGGGCPTPTASSYAALVLADQPIAYWRLGDCAGTVAKDQTSNHVDGAYQTVELSKSGLIHGDPDAAAAFDGTLQSGVLLDTQAFAFPGNAKFTLEAWFRPDVIQTSALITTIGDLEDGYELAFTAGELRFTRRAGGLDAAGSVAPPSVLKVAHVVATFDGAQVCVWVNASSPNCASSAGTLVATGTPLRLGRPFEGTLDEVAIYADVLPSARISAHYDGGKAP